MGKTDEEAAQLLNGMAVTGRFASGQQLAEQVEPDLLERLAASGEKVRELPTTLRDRLIAALGRAPLSQPAFGRLLELMVPKTIEFQPAENWKQTPEGLLYQTPYDFPHSESMVVSEPFSLEPDMEAVLEVVSESKLGRSGRVEAKISVDDGQTWQWIGNHPHHLAKYAGQTVRLGFKKVTGDGGRTQESFAIKGLQLRQTSPTPSQTADFSAFQQTMRGKYRNEWCSGPKIFRGEKLELALPLSTSLRSSSNEVEFRIREAGSEWTVLHRVRGDQPHHVFRCDLTPYANRTVELSFHLSMSSNERWGRFYPGQIEVKEKASPARVALPLRLSNQIQTSEKVFETVLDPARPQVERERILSAWEALLSRCSSGEEAEKLWALLEPVSDTPDLPELAVMVAEAKAPEEWLGRACETENELSLLTRSRLAQGREPLGSSLSSLQDEAEGLENRAETALSWLGQVQWLAGPDLADQVWKEVSDPFRDTTFAIRREAFQEVSRDCDPGTSLNLYRAVRDGLAVGESLVDGCAVAGQLFELVGGAQEKVIEAVEQVQQWQRHGFEHRSLKEVLVKVAEKLVVEEDLQAALDLVRAERPEHQALEVEADAVVINQVAVDVRPD